MSFRRREYGGHFAILDINFVLNDPRLDTLTATQRWIFITLWCISIEERNDVLPASYYPPNPQRPGYHFPQTLARLSREDPRTIPTAIAKLQQNCMIQVSSSGEITVCGIKDKHPNLKWKDDPETDQIQFDVKETELETELEEELEIKKEKENETERETETETKSETEIESQSESEPDSESALPKSSCSDDDCGVIDFKRKMNTIFNFYIKESGRDPSRYRLIPRRAGKINAIRFFEQRCPIPRHQARAGILYQRFLG